MVHLLARDAAGATVVETSTRMVNPATGEDLRLDATGPVELAP